MTWQMSIESVWNTQQSVVSRPESPGRLVTFLDIVHPTCGDLKLFPNFPTILKEKLVKKMLCRLILMCLLAAPVAVFAQSNDNVKQDQS